MRVTQGAEAAERGAMGWDSMVEARQEMAVEARVVVATAVLAAVRWEAASGALGHLAAGSRGRVDMVRAAAAATARVGLGLAAVVASELVTEVKLAGTNQRTAR